MVKKGIVIQESGLLNQRKGLFRTPSLRQAKANRHPANRLFDRFCSPV